MMKRPTYLGPLRAAGAFDGSFLLSEVMLLASAFAARKSSLVALGGFAFGSPATAALALLLSVSLSPSFLFYARERVLSDDDGVRVYNNNDASYQGSKDRESSMSNENHLAPRQNHFTESTKRKHFRNVSRT